MGHTKSNTWPLQLVFEAMWNKLLTKRHMRTRSENLRHMWIRWLKYIESPIGTTTVAARNSAWAKILTSLSLSMKILELEERELYYSRIHFYSISLHKPEIVLLVSCIKKSRWNWPLVLLTRFWPEAKVENANSSIYTAKNFFLLLSTFLGGQENHGLADQIHFCKLLNFLFKNINSQSYVDTVHIYICMYVMNFSVNQCSCNSTTLTY